MGLVTPVDPVPVDQLGRVPPLLRHPAEPGMVSGIARIMLARGVSVSGSDAAGSALLDELAVLGAAIRVGHDAAHLTGADTLVVSTAIRPDNPELVAARESGLRVLHRAAALASVMASHQGGGSGKHRTARPPPRHAHHRAARLRRGPVLRDRRHPYRDRPGCG